MWDPCPDALGLPEMLTRAHMSRSFHYGSVSITMSSGENDMSLPKGSNAVPFWVVY